ncbi:hypothetical protein [Arcticibacterium luteifluviistationis]|uniref:Uncharacterized protein n=1 Tax=Arcticibacterium luteifluviistationis TaxID=1784714 RepID=A0A2Z4G9R5_9BACT|nr:hypothetical protein [Arcticibacterium luteifluviistationis]AWV97979.1 hypothetical protein DJ013_07270 [Arcticibacterium luteifluviistationis]
MNPIFKNILAIVAGVIVGSAVNMGLVMLGPILIPPPEGADITTMKGLTEAMPLMQPKHFIFPFLAHALGTLAGAWVVAKIAATRKLQMAMTIGLFFLFGGIMNIQMLPGSPEWFNVLDVVLAYLPMAWLGRKLAKG